MYASSSLSTADLDASARLLRGLEWILAFFAALTIAYDVVLLMRWPCYFIAIGAMPLAVAAIGGGAMLRRGMPESAVLPDPWADRFALLLIGMAVVVYTLLVNRPDSDDVAYLRRAVVQATSLRSPVVVSNVTYDADVPDVVPTQYLVSYEILVGMAGRVLHCDPVNLYFNVFPAVIAFLVPWVYYLLFRAFDLAPKVAVLAVLGAMLFLVLDGNAHWSPGNFAFVRIWQGKCALVTLGLPAVVLFSWRYLRRPGPAAWYAVFLSGICAVGLSATGLFIIPALLLATGLAYVIGGREMSGEQLAVRCRRAANLNLAAIYPLSVTAILVTGIVPVAREVALVLDARSWLDHLYGFGDTLSLVWYGALLLLGPLLMLKRSYARVLVWLPVVGLALYFNPVTGPILVRKLTTNYFRLGYVLPVALAAGLAFAALGRLPSSLAALRAAGLPRVRASGVLVALALLTCLFVMQARQFTFSPGNHPCAPESVACKALFADRFDRGVDKFARAVSPRLDQAIVLAPWEASVALALLNPHARFAITRSNYTRWSFSVKDELPQWQLRDRAQALVAEPAPVTGGREALRELARQGVNAVVVAPDADYSAVQAALAESGCRWTCATGVSGYRLLLR
jgi:hypothetical protein